MNKVLTIYRSCDFEYLYSLLARNDKIYSKFLGYFKTFSYKTFNNKKDMINSLNNFINLNNLSAQNFIHNSTVWQNNNYVFYKKSALDNNGKIIYLKEED